MNQSNKLLSDLVSFRTYAKHIKHLSRRESLEETINRDMFMHLEKYPKLSKEIIKAFGKVHELKVMPSMRALQFGGEAILKNNTRQYNCSYLPIDNISSFSESLFLLLSGVGVGYSVQKEHVNQLPKIGFPQEDNVYLVHDSIQGWALALEQLMQAYFLKRVKPVFDFTQIRPKNSYLVTTGAKAPGPEPLKAMLSKVEEMLKISIGRKLKPIEVHDIVCVISDCVLSGGIRRAALISLFDRDDFEMLKCKSGEWWIKHAYRARANNSAVLPRDQVNKEEFKHIFNITKESNSGEPGFSWTNNALGTGFNPSLRGSTRVWTKEFGMVPIKELESKKFTVKNLYGNEAPAECWLSSPKEKLIKIKLSNGYEYFCTKEHKWPVINNNGYTKVDTIDLKVGMKFPRLSSQKLKNKGKGSFQDGILIGYFYGDGWITDRTDTGKRQYGVCIPHSCERKQKYKELFTRLYQGEGCLRSSTLEFNSTSNRLNDYFKQFGVDKKEKGLPEFLFRDASDEFINGFIEGFFDADGHLAKDGRTSISSNTEKIINDLHDLLGFKGIYLSKTSINFDHYVAKGKKYIKDTKRTTLRRNWKKASNELECSVISIEHTNIEEPVWDIRVNDNDETHCFQLSGCVTGNCHEISLVNNQFCNLTTVNQTGIKDKKDFLSRVYSATLIGTIQAGYTDFPYLRDVWRHNTEREALLGVSFTGIADASNVITDDWLQEAAKLVLEVNEKYAKKIGINMAARTTAIKPEGTSSCVLGSSSGIHARHSQYYLRRFRINKSDSLDKYLRQVIPDLVEDDLFSTTGSVVTIPQESPSGAILRENESAIDLLNRAYRYNSNWVQHGHRTGDNQHNVSATISIKENEWKDVEESMWKNRNRYSGISLLPYDLGNYQQTPFEECTKEKFEEYSKLVKSIDLREIREEDDNTTRSEQLACTGGVCEITSL